MRVLEIMGSLHRGGAETMIMNYYRAFDREVCQMDFVIHAEFEDDYCEEAKSMGANIFLLERPGEIGAVQYIKQLVETIIENGPYDAIHVHTNYQAFLSVTAAHRAGIKNIIVHSHTTSFKKHEIIINRMIFALFKTKNVACGEAAGKAFFGNNNFIILNNAIDVKEFSAIDLMSAKRIKAERYGTNKIIGHLGSFTPPKNHAFLILMIKELLKYRNDFKLLLYGSGNLQDSVEMKVKQEGLGEFIEFCGVTKNPAFVYKTFDIFVLPSLYEGFPVTLVESQLSGVHSIASDAISQECDLHNGNLEFLPLEEDLWAQRINEILDKTELIDKPKVDLADFDVNVQWKRLLELYR